MNTPSLTTASRPSIAIKGSLGGRFLAVPFMVVFLVGFDLSHVVAYWFAWAAFHPKTALYQAPQRRADQEESTKEERRQP